MSEHLIWRIEPLTTPVWNRPCRPCGHAAEATSVGRFRVNANGSRVDVWLLYRCTSCGTTGKRALHRRVSPARLADLRAYLRDDPELARRHAFELPVRTPLPFRLIADPTGPPSTGRWVRIDQPHPCGLRWTRLLATGLGWSRARVARAWKDGRIELDGAVGVTRKVAHGQRFRCWSPEP